MRKLKETFLALLFFCSVLSSCRKEDNLVKQIPHSNDAATGEFVVKNGMFCFNSMDSYHKTLDLLDKMGDAEAEKWEASIGITTQRRIFNKIVQAENELLLNPYENIKEEDALASAKPKQEHSNLYYEYLNKGLIKVLYQGTIDEYFDYAVVNPALAKIINAEGFLAIGNTLYQLTSTEIKSKENYSLSDIGLLNSVSQTNDAEKIIVERPNLTAKVMGVFDFNLESSWGYSSSNDRRIKVKVVFSSNLTGGGTGCTASHNVNVVIQKKNIWGSWVPSAQQMWLNGNWDSQFTLFDYQELDYFPTYSYYNATVNNFWSSISPTSGAVAPYPSSFLYKAPSGNPFWYELDILNGVWTASTSGGCCGAGATLNVY